jgi:primosomal protein N' (replication factor Y)
MTQASLNLTGDVCVNYRLRVALPVPINQAFDYWCATEAPVGARVRANFGYQGKMVGVVTGHVDVNDPMPPGVLSLREVSKVLDLDELIPAELREMADFTHRYYHAPLGEVFSLAMPKLLRDGKPAKMITIEGWEITSEGQRVLGEGEKGNAKLRYELLKLLDCGRPLVRDDFIGLSGGWRESLKRMARQGLVRQLELQSVKHRAVQTDPGFELMPEQAEALEAIVNALGSYTGFVLDGTTGSGKTEVYIRAAQEVIDRGGQVLVLIPEIGLTPQTANRFRERLDTEVLVLHSGLTDSERADAWLRARAGKARVIVGTRSSIWTALDDLALIIVDEEHDRSYKQADSGVRYNARDLAIWRAHRRGIPIVLGSATPSLETFKKMSDGDFHRLRLKSRTGAAGLPDIEIVDMAGVKRAMHPASIELLQKTVDQGHQGLVFLNRRGWAPALMCTECGTVHHCHSCDHPMVHHRSKNRMICHWCGNDETTPPRCTSCGSPNLVDVGHGTERIDEFLAAEFPDVPVIRIDRDTVRSKNAMEEKLAVARRGDPCILVGTQMLAKGHDLPMLTAVVVLDIDSGLFSTELRSQEFLAQTLTQVSGRAGRADVRGRVLVQTKVASHGLLQEVLFRGYHKALSTISTEREAAMMPPFTNFAVLRFSTPNPVDCDRFNLVVRNGPQAPDGVAMNGPVVGNRAKIAGRFQFYYVVESRDRKLLHGFLSSLRGYLDGAAKIRGLRWVLDVDPYQLAA